MRIDEQDKFHGAALAQIARHQAFTAINVIKSRGAPSRSAFFVNHDIGIYLKYASEKTETYDEYFFQFSEENLKELRDLTKKRTSTFVVLVCVADRAICCVEATKVFDLKEKRDDRLDEPEDAFSLIASLPEGKQFRVYANYPGTRGRTLGQVLVPRNAFPNVLFQ